MTDRHDMQASGDGKAGDTKAGAGDGVNDVKGGGESQGGRWPGRQDAPANPDPGVVTHVERETMPAADEDGTAAGKRAE